MKPPRGVLKPGQEWKVCHLLKGLYGLKQAGWGWYKEMSGVFINDLKFKRSAVDHSVFYWQNQEKHTIIVIATNDMAVTSKWIEDVEKFKQDIKHYWEITDNHEIKWFLGFEIKHNRIAQTISISQQSCIHIIIEWFRLTNAKRVMTPFETGTMLSKELGPSTPTQVMQIKGVTYAKAIGCVLWTAVVSRPDIMFVTGVLAQFVQNPEQPHWEALKRVINYLGWTSDLWLTFSGKPRSDIYGYTDADRASQKDQHSTSGYSFHLGQGAITWSSKKQHIIALSSMEVEYTALTHMAKEALWLQSMVSEIFREDRKPVVINCDNQGSIVLSRDNKYHSQMKHIDIRYHFIREAVKDSKVKVNYVPTEENIADIFNKPLTKSKFGAFTRMVGLAAR